MKTPFMKYAKKAFEFIQDKIICPIPRKLSRDAILGKIEDFAEFFYQKSKDPATMMIVFDLISLGTSTLAQINGLKKSDRENKDYLIQQEMSEAIASLPLTIGLPYFFTKWISRQLESGKVMTKSTRAILDNVIKPYCGVQGKEAFYVAPKLKTKQWLEIEINSILKKLKKTKILPKGLRNRIQVKNINPNTNVPLATLFDLLYDFDQQVFDELKETGKTNFRDLNFFKDPKVKQTLDQTNGLYKNSAVSHIKGEIDGIKILSIILLNIAAGNIVMPIIKNKITNYMYNKELKAKGETPESIRRKKRYGNLKQISTDIETENNIFDIFSNSDNTITTKPVKTPPIKNPYGNLVIPKEQNIFTEISTFSQISSQSNGLRI